MGECKTMRKGNAMARYKHIEQTFMFRRLLEFWGNMVENCDDDCRDHDFFEVADRCFDKGKSIDLIKTAYTREELDSISNGVGSRRELDFDDGLGDVFYVLWNSEGSRRKCRVVLDTMRKYVMSDISRKTNEAVERRFAELKRSLKLSDLEADILMFAYIRDQTCFCWPRRIEDREKPMYYAMALDRSFAEVSQVNEILQQMENFGGIMVAATNFSKNLDPATMRRFAFKLEFDYLDDAGKKLFFERFFKTTLSDDELSELRELRNLAPGDFRTVRQEMFYLGEDASNQDRIAALKEECNVKKDGNSRIPIGFR